MTTHTWYAIAFVLSGVVTAFLFVLGTIVFLKGKREYLNIACALGLIFTGLVFASGFVEKIPKQASDSLTLFVFQWSYAAGILAFLLYFLLVSGLYLGRAPKKPFIIGITLFALIGVAVSFSPWLYKSAHYENGSFTSITGTLYFLGPTITLLLAISCIVTAIAARYKSSGIDRARMNIISMGFLIFFPIPLVFSYILPGITGDSNYTNYSYLGALIPIGTMTYAIIRLRLLDVRIILRRTGLLIIFFFLMSMPLALLLIVMQRFDLPSSEIIGISFALFVLLIGLAPSAWKRLEKFSSRLFFSGLYDAGQLKSRVQAMLASSSDPTQAIPAVLRELIAPLTFETLGIFISPGVLADYSLLYKSTQKDAGISFSVDTAVTDLENIPAGSKTIIAEELRRWPQDEREAELGQLLSSQEISGCVPLQAGDRTQGYFLLGPKIGKSILSVTDIHCLEDIGAQLGLHIDNYCLSAQLKVHLDELEKVYEELQKADEFKTEIINLTSHELRTPLTILSAFTQILQNQYPKSNEDQRLQYLEYMKEACQRLALIIEQFLTVSNLQKGLAYPNNQEVFLEDLFLRLKESFDKEAAGRIKAKIIPSGAWVSSDPFYLFLMLKNLLENALRFSDEEKPIYLEAVSDEGGTKISVLDFGDGIAAEEADFIFQPFTRLEDLDQHHTGIGLGLYSVRLIADLLGTEINVKAGAEEGTEFSFRLETSHEVP